jgi:hypothetical protein
MKSKLKKMANGAIICSILLVLLSLISLSGYASCVDCSTPSTLECYRVIVNTPNGTETHVYHGIKKDCPQE